MNTSHTTTSQKAQNSGVFLRAYANKGEFFVAFLGVFLVSVSVAASLDILPDAAVAIGKQEPAKLVASVAAVVASPTLPTEITISAIDLRVAISNPTSTDTKVLDNALLKGAVRYPTSARLGEQGNVILFGHSSYLPLVNNKAFKAFDDIQKLNVGDEIVVNDGATAYTYAVESVAKATTEADSVPLSVIGSKLTLVTCNSFASHDDRFVVTAKLVGSNPLGT